MSTVIKKHRKLCLLQQKGLEVSQQATIFSCAKLEEAQKSNSSRKSVTTETSGVDGQCAARAGAATSQNVCEDIQGQGLSLTGVLGGRVGRGFSGNTTIQLLTKDGVPCVQT